MKTRGTHFLAAAFIFLLAGAAHPAGAMSPDQPSAGPEGTIPFSLPGLPLLPVLSDVEWVILNEHNQKIHVFESDSLAPWQAKQWFVRADGHEWIIDHQLKALTPVHYEHLDRIGENLVLFRENGKSGVMEPGGKKILEARYDVIRREDNLILAGRGQAALRWKIFDQQGNMISPYNWEEIGKIQKDHLIPVKRNGFWGLIDTNGEQQVDCVYDSLGEFVGDRIGVRFKGLYGIIDRRDTWVIRPGRVPLTPLNERLYISRREGLTTISSYETGTVYFTSNPIEMKKGYFVEALEDGTFWKINYSGRIINSEENLKQYQEIRLPSEGFIAVRIHGKYGFIDEQDRLRIAHRYDDVRDFHEGLAGFQLMNRWGFLNKQENIVVQPMYDEVEDFTDGLCVVRRGSKYGAINADGKEIASLQYDAIKRQENGRFVIIKDGKKGLMNAEGRIIVFPRYEDIRDLTDGQVIVRIGGKYGVISRLGDDLIPAIYDQITFDPFNGYYLAMKKK